MIKIVNTKIKFSERFNKVFKQPEDLIPVQVCILT